MIDYGNLTDEGLTDLLRNGDSGAFNEIYKRYWRKMLGVAWNHSRDTSVSKDIVHEVFISLWERRYDNVIQTLPAFLARSVRLSVYRQYQKEQRRAELAKLHYEPEIIGYDEEKLDAKFLQEYIEGIVEELPEKCRLVFRYSRDQGMKNAEIASLINITEKGVEASLTRALKIIRIRMKNYGLILLVVLYYYKALF